MTSPTTGMPLLTPDTAWRQWRNAAATRATLKAKEETDPHRIGATADTDRAIANEHQARATWLITMLEHFGRRVEETAEAGHDVTSAKALRGLGLPCADCLTVADEKSATHKIMRDETKQFTVWASCGGNPIDPLTTAMPQW